MDLEWTRKPCKVSHFDPENKEYTLWFFNELHGKADLENFFTGPNPILLLWWCDQEHLEKTIEQRQTIPDIDMVKHFMLKYPDHLDAEINQLYSDVTTTLQEEAAAKSLLSFNQVAFQEVVARGSNEAVARFLQAKNDCKSFACAKALQLQHACHVGDLPLVQLLVDNGADPDLAINDQNAMSRACVKGCEDVVKYLMTIGVEINPVKRPALKHTPLQAACKGGCVEIVNILLAAGALLDQDASLRYAAQSGFLEVVERLLVAGASVDYTPETKGQTALQVAAAAGHYDIVILLLRANADVNYVKSGMTALQRAIVGHHINVIRLLISVGANPNLNHPITLAAEGGKLEIVNLILTAGAKLLPYFNGGIASIENAAKGGYFDILQRLFQALEEQNVSLTEMALKLSLSNATEGGHVKVVQFLLTINPWPGLFVEWQDCLVDKATRVKNLDLVKLVLEAGAGINNIGYYFGSFTALQSAIESRCNDIAIFLIASGANVSAFHGPTSPPLHMAARNGDFQMVKRLVEAGADVESISYERLTTIEAAIAGGNQDILRYLQGIKPQIDSKFLDSRLRSAANENQILCSKCQSLPLKVFESEKVSSHGSTDWHPSLYSLRSSIDSGCQFCLLLWNELGIDTISLPQPSPITINRQTGDRISVDIREPHPRGVERPRRLHASFHAITEPFNGRRRSLGGDTSSSATSDQSSSWLAHCIKNHPKCQITSDQYFLPTRLIDLTAFEDTGTVRLLNSDQLAHKTEHYVTLSHCWGGKLARSAMTTESNFKENCKAISYDHLPATFKQAIQVTNSLGIRYLWIDSLCIIQDLKEDWERESSKMSEVYLHATLCIAATASSNSSEGLFRQVERKPLRRVEFSCKSKSGEEKKVMVVPHQQSWTEMYRSGPLSKRGWTLQERELSSRVLHFGSSQILWECRTCRSTEGSDNVSIEHNGVPLRLLDHINDLDERSIHDLWFELVIDYKSRSLTNYTDFFPAIGGLAQTVSRFTKSKYVAGLWMDDLTRSLGWASSEYHPGSKYAQHSSHTRALGYIAPTWSFASVIGLISFSAAEKGSKYVAEFLTKKEVFQKASLTQSISVEIQKAEVILATPDPFGQLSSSFLHISAPVLNAIPHSSMGYAGSNLTGRYVSLKDVKDSFVGHLHYDIPSNEGKFAVLSCIYLYPRTCPAHGSLQYRTKIIDSVKAQNTDLIDPALTLGCGVGMAITQVIGQAGKFERVGHIRCLLPQAFLGLDVINFTLI